MSGKGGFCGRVCVWCSFLNRLKVLEKKNGAFAAGVHVATPVDLLPQKSVPNLFPLPLLE